MKLYIIPFYVSRRTRKDLDMSRLKKDEEAIKSISETVKAMVNPFAFEGKQLVNIASGVVANREVAEDLSNMCEKGEAKASEFIKSNVLVDNPDLYERIKKSNIKTFASSAKLVSVKTKKDEVVVLKSTKDLFARLLLLATSREVDMEDVLKYSLRPFPSPLATVDGSLLKCTKSSLLHIIESDCKDQLVENVPQESALIVDAMAVLQTSSNSAKSFGELALKLLRLVVGLARSFKSKRVDFVSDRYPEKSLKSEERHKRASSGQQVVKIFSKDQKVPIQWKKYMSVGQNKEELIDFLYDFWCSCPIEEYNGIEIYVSHKDQCHRLAPRRDTLIVEIIEELTSNHEEADTRLALHASHASHYYRHVIVKSPDTDVFVILLAFQLEINAKLYFATGVQSKKRIISIEKLVEHWNSDWCRAFIGFHAFTGKTF